MIYRHISDAVKETLQYIEARKNNQQTPLYTSKKKLNKAIDGFSWGRIYTLAGLSGCLAGDSIVNIKRGKRTGHRKYSIEYLFQKFNKDKGWNKDTPSYIMGYNGDSFQYTQIRDVIFSGNKEVFRVLLDTGENIKATADHRFLTQFSNKEEHFIKLENLQEGDEVITRYRNIKKKKKFKYRREYSSKHWKYYPNARLKKVNGHNYYNCLEQRVVYDAWLNDLSVEDFLEAVTKPNSLLFSESYLEIHHKDGNTHNNDISNLELLTKEEHANEHLVKENHLYKARKSKIISIQSLGIKPTYDIMCTSPIHNFIANDIVVHNCGKSLTIEEIKRDLIDYNKEQNFDILSFEFEMLAIDQIARNLSGKVQKSVPTLFSANKEFLSDEDFEEVKETAQELLKYPIYYVDEVGTTSEVERTIFEFLLNRKDKNRGIVITIDHVLLTKGVKGESEKEVVDNLMHKCVELKKSLTAEGYKVMFILLSQLNREIEKQDRVMNPLFHYPTKNDIFAASSVYYCSDVVIILHKPAIIEGLGSFYGTAKTGYPNGLPIFTEDKRAMIYWHIIKSRFGNNQILSMVDDFANSRVLEYLPNN